MKGRLMAGILSVLLLCPCLVAAEQKIPADTLKSISEEGFQSVSEDTLKVIGEETLKSVEGTGTDALFGTFEKLLAGQAMTDAEKKLIDALAAAYDIPLTADEMFELFPKIKEAGKELDAIRNTPEFQELLAYAKEHQEVQILVKSLLLEAVGFARTDPETTRKVLLTMGASENAVLLFDQFQEKVDVFLPFLRIFFDTQQGQAFISEMELLTGDEDAETFLLDLVDQMDNKTVNEGEQR